MRSLSKALVWSLLLLVLAPQLWAQQLIDPRLLKWWVLETEHFKIVYHQGLEGMAQEAAIISEEAYEALTKEFGWKLKGSKIHIVLADEGDFGGGFAQPDGEVVWVYASHLGWGGNPRGRGYLADLLYHEIAHIIHLNVIEGIPKQLQRLFGKAIMPTIDTSPWTFIEGLVSYQEYKHLGMADLNSPWSMMYMRTMAIDGNFPTFGRTSFTQLRPGPDWPPLSLYAYDYGSWLMRYIEQTYGKDAVARIVRANARSYLTLLPFIGRVLRDSLGLPFLNLGPNFSSVLKEAIGVSADEVYEGFHRWLREHFKAQIDSIQKDGITAATRITPYGYWAARPAWSNDWIAYGHYHPARGSSVRLITPDGQRDHQIAAGFPVSLAWSADGKSLLYAKADDVHRGYYRVYDLYVYDLKAKKERRLTHGQRAYRAVFAPDGRIIFAQRRWGELNPVLAILDTEKNEIRVLREFEEDARLHSLALAPDGKRLALSIWKRGGFSDLYLLSIEGGELKALTQDHHPDLNPAWSPDGKYILFESERGQQGTMNIYALSIEDQKLFRVTNMLTGAFQPAVSPDGEKIAFLSYSSRGYDLYTMHFEPQAWRSVEFEHEEIPAWAGYPKTPYPVRRYDPVPSLSPRGWRPIISAERVGAVVGSFWDTQDALLQHWYSFELGYLLKERSPFYELSYWTSPTPLKPLSFLFALGRGGAGNWQRLSITLPLLSRVLSRASISLEAGRFEFDRLSYRVSGSFSFSKISPWDLWRSSLGLSLSGALTWVPDRKEPIKVVTATARHSLRLAALEDHFLAFRLVWGWRDFGAFRLGGLEGPFAIRGQPPGALGGPHILLGSLEYDFHLLRFKQSLGYWPIFLNDLRGRAFFDLGAVAGQMRLGFGAELLLNFSTGYWWWGIKNLKLGIAQGVGQEQPLLYFTLW